MKDYTQEEIDSLINEIKNDLIDPLVKSAKEEVLAKGEKTVEASKEGGNGTVPVAGKMAKDEAPMAKEASDEKSPVAGSPDAAPKSQSGSDSPADSAPAASASASPTDAPPADASASDMGAGPAGAPSDADPAMGGGTDLAQAYGELDDASLSEHWQALSGEIAKRLAGAQAGGMGGPDMGSPAMGSPGMDAAPAGPAMGQSSPPPAAPPAMAPAQAAPAEKSMPMAMKSEKELELQTLVKSQSSQIEELQKSVAGLLGVVETVLQPKRKAITSMSQVLVKSEGEGAPNANNLTVAQKHVKLMELAKTPNLKKSVQDALTGYFLKDKNLSEVEHLIK